VTTAIAAAVGRSAFTAAFLTFLFPGLGQLYAGRGRRAAVFALPAVLLAAGAMALLAHYGPIGFGLWLGQTSVLGPLAFLNAGVLAYRLTACLDAYLLCLRPLSTPPYELGTGDGLAGQSPTPGVRSFHRARRSRWASLAGLAGIAAVLVADHAIVGYWDVRLYDFARELHSPVAIATDAPDSSPEPVPDLTLPPQVTYAPEPTPEPWEETGRLNILLVGVDNQAGGFRTDSMIVVSVDTTSHKVVMFSIPRDTSGVPLPPNSRLSALYGRSYPYKLNTLWKYSDKYRDLFPGGGADALKQAIGFLFFGDQAAISYYVLVDLIGFQKVVDALGGVTIDVPAPVVDNGFPGVPGTTLHRRIYIAAGIQHMNGEQALAYVRSRKASNYYNDYNRSARQQQLLVALQQQADFVYISTHVSELMDALSQAIHTDLPEGPDVLGALIDEARQIRSKDIITYAFSPPTYGISSTVSGTYVFIPNVDAIRKAVQGALAGEAPQDPFQAAIDEGAPILVENGTGVAGRDTALAGYLAALGFAAQASTSTPSTTDGMTRLLSVNGAADEYPATFEQLQKILGLSGQPSTDPDARLQAVSEAGAAARFVIVTGTDAPAPSPSPDGSSADASPTPG
jgi:LCP family protein required for cell wall assembly